MAEEIPQWTSAEEKRLIDWFHHSGGVLDPRCAIAHYEGMGRGVRARQDIAKDDLLFTIPRHVLLNTRTSVLPLVCQQADTEANGKATASAASSSSTAATPTKWSDICEGWTPLILCIMWERWRTHEGREAWEKYNSSLSSSQTASAQPLAGAAYDQSHGQHFSSEARPQGEQEWSAYLDLLPEHFDTPMFWSEDDIKELEGTNVIGKVGREDAERAYKSLVLPYIHHHPSVFLGVPTPKGEALTAAIENSYSLDTFHRMGSSVLSRSFHVEKPKTPKPKRVDADGDTSMGSSNAGGGHEEEIGGHAEEDEEDEEDSDDDSSDGEGDDQEDVGDISLTPVADLLNARYQHDNVSTPHARGLRMFAIEEDLHGGDPSEAADKAVRLEARARRALDAAERFGGEKGRARLYYKALTLEMRATKDIAAGEQIFNTYADPPNSDLLRRYGHCDEPNGNDVVELEATTLVSSALATFHSSATSSELETLRAALLARVEWWCSATILEDVFVLTYLFPPSESAPFATNPSPSSSAIKRVLEDVPEDLLIASRLLCMSEAKYANCVQKDRTPSPRAEAVETQPDGPGRASCKLLLHALRARLAQYPTTAEQDELALYGSQDQPAAQGLVGNKRKACIVRLGEKRILHDTIRVLVEVEKAVDKTTKTTGSSGLSKKRGPSEKASGSGSKRRK